MSPLKRRSRARKSRPAPRLSASSVRANMAEKAERIGPRFDECRVECRRLGERDRATLHQIARMGAAAAEHDQRAGDHAAAGTIARRAFDDDRAAAKPVARPLSGAAAHDQHAAGHALHLAFARRAEKIAGVALDLEPAAAHAEPA